MKFLTLISLMLALNVRGEDQASTPPSTVLDCTRFEQFTLDWRDADRASFQENYKRTSDFLTLTDYDFVKELKLPQDFNFDCSKLKYNQKRPECAGGRPRGPDGACPEDELGLRKLARDIYGRNGKTNYCDPCETGLKKRRVEKTKEKRDRLKRDRVRLKKFTKGLAEAADDLEKEQKKKNPDEGRVKKLKEEVAELKDLIKKRKRQIDFDDDTVDEFFSPGLQTDAERASCEQTFNACQAERNRKASLQGKAADDEMRECKSSLSYKLVDCLTEMATAIWKEDQKRRPGSENPSGVQPGKNPLVLLKDLREDFQELKEDFGECTQCLISIDYSSDETRNAGLVECRQKCSEFLTPNKQ